MPRRRFRLETISIIAIMAAAAIAVASGQGGVLLLITPLVVIPAFVLLVVRIVGHVRQTRRTRALHDLRCTRCGFDLSAHFRTAAPMQICPECGMLCDFTPWLGKAI